MAKFKKISVAYESGMAYSLLHEATTMQDSQGSPPLPQVHGRRRRIQGREVNQRGEDGCVQGQRVQEAEAGGEMNSPTHNNPCFTHCDQKCAAFTQDADIPADCPDTRYACPAPDGSPAAGCAGDCGRCGVKYADKRRAR